MTDQNIENTISPGKGFASLPRGGYLVETSAGIIQFGAPPETIKDTMTMKHGVPEVYVLTGEMFNWIKGISIAEIEFPIYYNFFFRNKKTYIICRENQFRQMKKVLQESIFGPESISIAGDYIESGLHVPEISREIDYFRNNRTLADLVAFGIIKNNSFKFHGVIIETDASGGFTVSDNGQMIAEVPATVSYKATYKIGERLPEPYVPPLFGVTCLGPSHGFDPEENTSGFIIWLNHQGIMVDPPVNSTEWLEDSNVNPKFIDSIILTHCHADHDAGTFQKILEEGRVTIYTTETVMMSFLRKYSSLTGMPVSYLLKLFTFHPVHIGAPVFINGGRFDMFYTLHSIPTIGFRMEFQDQTFVYSSDHNNDPGLHEKLLKEGVISRERYDELRAFPWDSKVIYHESGVPPLHTPVAHMNSLPAELQKRIVIYHIAKKDFPKETSLQLARFGIEHTLYFKTTPPEFEKSYQILGLLKCLDFSRDLPINKAQEFIQIVRGERYSKGDKIIRKGTPGDKFFIIYSGNVSVDSGGLEKNKIYGAYDYFGEVALVTGQNRAADVIAETDVTVYTVARDEFLNFIVGTRFERTLKRLAHIRNSETWNVLTTSQFFKLCSASQITWLESMFIPMDKSGPGVILSEGESLDHIYILRDGEVQVCREGSRVAVMGRGDFIGSFQEIERNEFSHYTFRHGGDVSLYALPRDEVKEFLEFNPGLLVKLVYRF